MTKLFQVLLLCLLVAVPPCVAARNTVSVPGKNAVASAHALATAAGHTVLDAGGNAFDAAIAVAAALAVVEPYSSGIGGGGFFLVHDVKTGHDAMIDARETAPAAATPAMFLDAQGKVAPARSLNGALAAGIPGLPAGLVYVSKHYARLSLAQNLAPAIALAEQGFSVSEHYAIMAGFRASAFKPNSDAAQIFLRDGKAPALGTVLTQPDLARTLRTLKDKGLWTVGADAEGDGDVFSADLRGPTVLVMGAEGQGMRRLTREHCDLLVRIPMQGTVESLNVSVATGICLFEAVRQRVSNKKSP